jgi:predicted nucleotidyltransferase component of viral defense system
VSGLTAFQIEVARLFFGLPTSDGFLLAGGGALLASGLTDRPTHDLDFFGPPGHVDVTAARDQFEQAIAERGWRSEHLHDSTTFVRLHVTGAEDLIVEFAIDSAAGRPPVISIVGPTFDPEELAGRKLVALFSRAEARDFADVYVLAQRFDRATLLQRAHEVDPGFDRVVLAEMMSTLDRFDDDELPIGSADVTAVRTFFADWARELATDE